ncbi:Rho GTPase [Ceratobasidium sp. 428]|nr:Rho GTPase [Ceratobasidium sp. 428]
MNILRTIRKWVTRSETITVPGFDFDELENILQVKVVFVGDAVAGKSSLMRASLQRTPWIEPGGPYGSRCEVDVTDVKMPQGTTRLSLWDACVYDEFGGRLRPIAYRKTGIMALVFSVDNPDSLESLEEKWKEEVDHFCPGIPKVVIGCKSDLRAKNDGCIDTQLGVDLAKRIGARHYIECSAQQYVGIEELLERIGSMAWGIHERSLKK